MHLENLQLPLNNKIPVSVLRMRKMLSILICTFLISFAQSEENAQVWSRSIMPTCEFVYQVESDVLIKFHSEVLESYALSEKAHPLYVKAVFKNSWNQAPLKSDFILAKVDSKGRAEFTFESMSVSKGFLFREMYFQLGVLVDRASFYALSPVLKSDVGREFGEACHTQRQGEAQFVERLLVL